MLTGSSTSAFWLEQPRLHPTAQPFPHGHEILVRLSNTLRNLANR